MFVIFVLINVKYYREAELIEAFPQFVTKKKKKFKMLMSWRFAAGTK